MDNVIIIIEDDMKKQTAVEELTIMEAIDLLSSATELDEKELRAQMKKIEAGEEVLRLMYWLDLSDAEKSVTNIKHTLRTLKRYLEYYYTEERGALKEGTTQRAISAMMSLAKEAVKRLDKCRFIFDGVSISGLKEYRDLQEFYLKRIVNYIQSQAEDTVWQDGWGDKPSDLSDLKRRGLKGLEMVKKDRDYELFYILKEDGSAFFDRSLMRHLRLVTDFEENLVEIKTLDPLTKITLLHDKDTYASARQIRNDIAYDLNAFYDVARLKGQEALVSDLNNASMALMLASNPRNLMQNTSGKSCVGYFNDFQLYLRKILASTDYARLISSPVDQDNHLMQNVLNLAHSLTYAFFMRVGHREEALAFIYGLIAKSKKPQNTSHFSLWNHLLEVHEEIYSLLKHFPSGPLFKALDVFHPDDDFHGFDPVAQNNMPSKSFVISFRNFHIDCMRLPTPTRQRYIQKAEVTGEFQAYLRQVASHKRGDQHLLINLQDRTSWEEYARCEALENIQHKAEFANNLVVVTLPKYTDFYFQSDAYLKVNAAEDFLSLVLEQVKSGEECGFYFPETFSLKKAVKFTKEALPVIHKTFFASKNVLSRKNRLDFIEIFYYFLTLKIIEEVQPHSLSFTCKDAVDVGASTLSGFYAFLKLMSRSYDWQADEKDFLIWMLFAPALSMRERVIDLQRLSRTVSALSCVSAEMEASRTAALKACSALFDYPIFDEVSVFAPDASFDEKTES